MHMGGFLEKVLTTNQDYKLILSQTLIDGKVSIGYILLYQMEVGDQPNVEVGNWLGIRHRPVDLSHVPTGWSNLFHKSRLGWSLVHRQILPNMSTLNQLTLFYESLLYFAY